MARVSLIAAIFVLFAAGCASQSFLDGMRIPAEARSEDQVYFVMHQLKDDRGLDRTIVRALRDQGFNASDKREGAAFIVTYIDRWSWV